MMKILSPKSTGSMTWLVLATAWIIAMPMIPARKLPTARLNPLLNVAPEGLEQNKCDLQAGNSGC